jgi:hypothetical protein
VIVQILVQDRCVLCAERTIGSEIILDAPDVTPRWLGSNGISFRSVWRQCLCRCNIGAQFAPNVPHAHKSFWTHPMEFLGDVGQVESYFGLFRYSVSVDAR